MCTPENLIITTLRRPLSRTSHQKYLKMSLPNNILTTQCWTFEILNVANLVFYLFSTTPGELANEMSK